MKRDDLEKLSNQELVNAYLALQSNLTRPAKTSRTSSKPPSTIAGLSGRIAALEKSIRTEAAQGEATRRLMTMPGIGPISAMAIEAFAPPMESFRCGRDFAASC